MIHLLSALLTVASIAGATGDRSEVTPMVSSQPDQRISSTTNGLVSGARRFASVDTFNVFGGPGTLEGKFQDADGQPDWQGWVGADRTDQPVYWQVSTHNAANLGGHGTGNKAYWCGQTEEQAPHFVHTPGYGRAWNAQLIYESAPVSDPAVGQTVTVDFLFNIDVEPDYDYLSVEVDSAGTWVPLSTEEHGVFTGTNRVAGNVFPAPGLRFSDFGQNSFTWSGNDYGGPSADQVRIRIAFRSDGTFDDETGLFPTVGGAVQIDDLSISHEGADHFEDFEGPGPWLIVPEANHFVGDFSALYPGLTDLDPYHQNSTPVVGFMDRGQEVANAPDANGASSTGGSTSPAWNYAGGFVLNHDGGLTAGPGAKVLYNEVWSPPIIWDLPGTADDGLGLQGALLSFDVYNHLPMGNGMSVVWSVGEGIGSSLGFYNNAPIFSDEGRLWQRYTVDVSEFLRPLSLDHVRISLGVRDLSDQLGLPGGDATPAPWFDNVRLVKFPIDGGRIETDWNGAIRNRFPPNANNLDFSSPAARATHHLVTSFDVRVVRIAEVGIIDEVRLFWSLKKNPLFEDAIRTIPSSSMDESVVTGPALWTGERLLAKDGSSIWGVDDLLPHAYYPGDQIEYYIQATDRAGHVSTLPADLDGFGQFDGSYDPRFRASGLPTVTDLSGTQPEVLVYLGGESRSGIDLVLSTLGQLGMTERVDYDLHWGYGSSYSGIGPDVAPAELAGYKTILVFGGGGADFGYLETGYPGGPKWDPARPGLPESTTDLLTTWSNLPGDRNLVLFGSLLGICLGHGDAAAVAFLTNELGVQLVADELRPSLADQASPATSPLHPSFTTPFVVSGTDRVYCALDHVEPISPAVRAHSFDLPGGIPHPSAAASILRVTEDGADTKVHLTFPFSFQFIDQEMQRAPVGLPPRAALLAEVFEMLGTAAPSGEPTSAPATRQARLDVRPNPFNPRTTISLTLPQDGPASVRIFDLRGRRVRTLHDGRLQAGPHALVWDGRDDSGATTASGVYIVRADLEAVTLRRKVLLVR